MKKRDFICVGANHVIQSSCRSVVSIRIVCTHSHRKYDPLFVIALLYSAIEEETAIYMIFFCVLFILRRGVHSP